LVLGLAEQFLIENSLCWPRATVTQSEGLMLVHPPPSEVGKEQALADVSPPAGLPLTVTPEVGATITVKNTFLDFDSYIEDDADDMRRVASEPTARPLVQEEDAPLKVEMLPRSNRGKLPSIPETGFRESAAHLRLVESLECEADCEVVPSPSAPTALWPPTPESNFISARMRLGEPCRIEGTKMEMEADRPWMNSYGKQLTAMTQPMIPKTIAPPTGPTAGAYHPVLLGSCAGRYMPPPPQADATAAPMPMLQVPPCIPKRADDNMPKAAAISQLQETLQSVQLTMHFRYPAGVQVLQWSYKQRRESSRAMFRGIVAYLRDGVPHHVSGGWDSSKKLARQSAAEASVALLRGAWATPAEVPIEALVDLSGVLPTPGGQAEMLPATADHRQLLLAFCRQHAHMRMDIGALPSEPVWTCETPQVGGDSTPSGSAMWVAFVRLPILGVPHTLQGPLCASPQAACAELAQRSLWYLGCPSAHGLYMPDQIALRAAECKISPAPLSWSQALGGEHEA